MMKTLELITETIRSSRLPFHQVDDRPRKSQKHRYERRKVREYIKLGGDWASDQA